MIFPLAAAALTVVLDGMPVRSYNRPYIEGGHVMAPLDPYVTAIARSIEYDGQALIVRRGEVFAQVPMGSAPPPAGYQSTYVELAPIARTLGARVRFDSRTQTLYVETPRAALATPTPFNPAVPQAAPSMVFTPVPAQTPRPVVSGTPLPRRTPLPVQSPPPGAGRQIPIALAARSATLWSTPGSNGDRRPAERTSAWNGRRPPSAHKAR